VGHPHIREISEGHHALLIAVYRDSGVMGGGGELHPPPPESPWRGQARDG